MAGGGGECRLSSYCRKAERPVHTMADASGGKGLAANPQRRPYVCTGHLPVQIIAHLGSNDNEYLLEVQAYRPECCPACGCTQLHSHDDYWRWGLAQRVPVRRFRCARPRCRQIVSVLPSYLEPGQSYPLAVEELAVVTYVTGQATLTSVAAVLGVGTTTVFRWVDRACAVVVAWLVLLQQVLLLLNPAVDVDVGLRHNLRRLWRTRRIRKPGKEEQLLLLDQWPLWVERLRSYLSAFGAEATPDWLGSLAFWRRQMERLSLFVASTTEGGKACSPAGW